MNWSLIVAGALLLATAGCGDSDDDNSKDDDPTDEPTSSAYVERVNQLCDDLIDEVVPITGDGLAPDAKRYIKNSPKLAPIYANFDADVAAIPVESDADRDAKAAFTAYLEQVNHADAELTASAATMTDAELETAFTAFMAAFESSPERAKTAALGINCPAR